MSAVQLRVNDSQHSTKGRGAFSAKSLSADNVTPIAMTQIERFGELCNTTGKLVEQTQDLLKRYSAKRLGRLAMTIGWKKHDSASSLARSAGGHTAALISIALRNLYCEDQCGEVIYRVSTEHLPKEAAMSSIEQLADVADMLATKMSAIGFGSFLAQQAVRISGIYERSGLLIPKGLLDSLTVKSMSDLLSYCCEVLQENASILRITGSTGMGHIIGLILFLFPRDTLLSLSGSLIHEGARQNILLELSSQEMLPTMSIELGTACSPLKIAHKSTGVSSVRYHHKWRGWMAGDLKLVLLQAGLPYSTIDRVKVANLLVSSMMHDFPGPRRVSHMLGTNASLRMASICDEILLVKPTGIEDVKAAYFEVVTPLQDYIDRFGLCDCNAMKFDLSSTWNELSSHRCKALLLYAGIGESIKRGLCSFFIMADLDATITTSPPVLSENVIHDACFGHDFELGALIYDAAMGIVGATIDSKRSLIAARGSTIYPQSLETIAVAYSQPGLFRLLHGNMMFRGSYYSHCHNSATQEICRADQISGASEDSITPSALAVHSDLSLVTRETPSGLEIKAYCCYDQVMHNLPLKEICHGYMMLMRTIPCPHSPNAPATLRGVKVMLTSATRPLAYDDNLISIVMTKGDLTAQFISCSNRARTILIMDCCLDCAIQQAKDRSCKVIIVS